MYKELIKELKRSNNKTRYDERVTRYGVASGSSVYLHNNDDHMAIVATGAKAGELCIEHLGQTRLRDRKDYMMWKHYI